MKPKIRLLELLEEIAELQEKRYNSDCKEDAWGALVAIEGKIDDLIAEYDNLVHGLLDAVPSVDATNNCPSCTEEWNDHEESCPLFIGDLVLTRGKA